jgi:hypothetical protein
MTPQEKARYSSLLAKIGGVTPGSPIDEELIRATQKSEEQPPAGYIQNPTVPPPGRIDATRPGGASLKGMDIQYLKKLGTQLGDEYEVLPSQEVSKGLRRVTIRERESGQAMGMDMKINMDPDLMEPVITLGSLAGDKGEQVLQHALKVRVDSTESDPEKKFKFTGKTSSENLVSRIREAGQAYKRGHAESFQEGFQASLSGSLKSSPVPYIERNAPEVVRKRMMSKVEFQIYGPKNTDVAPYEQENAKEEYRQRLAERTGEMGSFTWEQYRQKFLLPGKEGELEPLTNISYQRKVGESIIETVGLVEGVATKGKQTVSTINAPAAVPYMQTPKGLRPYQPEEITNESYPGGYVRGSVRSPGTKERMAGPIVTRQAANLPGISPGSHVVLNDPKSFQPAAWGKETIYREELPDISLKDLLSGDAQFEMRKDVLGSEYPLGEQPINVGTFRRGKEEFPVNMQKGVSEFELQRMSMNIPAYVHPETLQPLPSKEVGGVSTEQYIPALQERYPDIEINRGTMSKIEIAAAGPSITGARERALGTKAASTRIPETMTRTMEGVTRTINRLGGEMKSPAVAEGFLAARNPQQWSEILSDYARIKGTPEAAQFSQQAQRKYIEGKETLDIDSDVLARYNRQLTRNLPAEQQFRGSGREMLSDIFSTVFTDQGLGTEQNVKNWTQLGGGYTPAEEINLPIHPEQYEMLQGFGVRALRQENKDLSEEEAGRIFEERLQLGEKEPSGIVAEALRSTVSETPQTQRMRWTPTQEETFTGDFLQPMIQNLGGQGQSNIEEMLSLSENYPKFAEAIQANIGQDAGEGRLKKGLQELVGFASFQKSAMAGKPVVPEDAEILTEEQMLKMSNILGNKDMSSREKLEGVGGVVKNKGAMLQFPGSGAVAPSIRAIEETSFSKYGDELGGILPKFLSSMKRSTTQELYPSPEFKADPQAGGTKAMSPLFNYVEKLARGKGEIAKHLFSKDVPSAITTGFVANPALAPNEIYLPKELRQSLLGRMGLSEKQIEKNMDIFEQEEGISAAALRYPFIGGKMLHANIIGERGLTRALGKEGAQKVAEDPELKGAMVTGSAISQLFQADYDWDIGRFIAGIRRKGENVEVLPPELTQELQEQSIEEYNQIEAAATPDEYTRNKSNAIVDSLDKFFGGKSPLKSALGKTELMNVQQAGEKSRLLESSKKRGVPAAYGIGRMQLASSLFGEGDLTAATQGVQQEYQQLLDMWNLGPETSGSRLAAAVSNINAGFDKEGRARIGYSTNIKDEQGYPETNYMYAESLGGRGPGSAAQFVDTLMSHAAAPTYEEGREDPIYSHGPEQLGYLFGKKEDRPELIEKLKAAPAEDRSNILQMYRRGLQEQYGSEQEYEGALLNMPIMRGLLGRTKLKAETPKSLESMEVFEQKIGTERTGEIETTAGMMSVISRFPKGVPQANWLQNLSKSPNKILASFGGRIQRALGIPSQISNLEKVASQQMPYDAELATATQQAQGEKPVDEELMQAAQKAEATSSGEQPPKEPPPPPIDLAAELGEPPPTPPGRYSSSNPPGGFGDPEDIIQRAYIQTKKMETRAPQLFQQISDYLNDQPGATDTTPMYKRFGNLVSDPKQLRAFQKATGKDVMQELLEARETSKLRKQGLGVLKRSSLAGTDPQTRKLLFDENVGESLSQLAVLGGTIKSSEAGINQFTLGQAEVFGESDPFNALVKQFKDAGITPDDPQFIDKMRKLSSSSPQAASMLKQASGFAQTFSGAKQKYLPENIQDIGLAAQTAEKMDKAIFKGAGSTGGTPLQLPTDEIAKLNQLYADQTRISKELTDARHKGNETEARTLSIQKEKIGLEINRIEAPARIGFLEQRLAGYREQFTQGSLDDQGYRRMLGTEREIDKLQKEQNAQQEEQQAGPAGRFARRMFGGFGLMYMRSIGNMMTSGMGYGQDERLSAEAGMAAQSAQIFGGGELASNQQIQLQNQLALSGSSYSARTGAQLFGAQNPWARELGGSAIAGVGAWGMMQHMGTMIPGLARFAGPVGAAVAVGNIGLQAYERMQSPDSLAMRQGTGRFSIADTAAAAGMRLFRPEQEFQQFEQDANFYNNIRNVVGQGNASFGQMQDLYGEYGYKPSEIYSGMVQSYMQMPGGDKYTQQSHQQATAIFARSSGLQQSTTLEQQLAGGFQLGMNYDQFAGQLLSGLGQGVVGQYGQGQNQQSMVDKLTVALSSTNIGEADKKQMEAGAQFYAQTPGVKYFEDTQKVLADIETKTSAYLEQMYKFEEEQKQLQDVIADPTKAAGYNPLEARYVTEQRREETQKQLDALQEPTYDASQEQLYYERGAVLGESRQGKLYLAQAQTAEAQRAAGLAYKTPEAESFFEEGTATLREMTPEQMTQGMISAQAQEYQAQQFLQQRQSLVNRQTMLGNQPLGEKLSNLLGQTQQTQPENVWAMNQAFNLNPQMLAYMGTQGLQLGDVGLKSFTGQDVSAAYLPQRDVGLNGQITGLGYGRTSFTQAGGADAGQMMQRMFGNWQNNQMFSQGALQAGLEGQQLSAPITLPNGEVVESVGGAMGMQVYQDNLAYEHQMAQIGRQQKSQQLQYAFTTGIGLSEYNTTEDPRSGRPFGNLGATGGFWGMEDQTRALTNTQQQWQFGFQQRQMNLGNQQFMENMAMNQRQQQQQRGWTRQDWGFQDENRAMQWGWKQEDFQENARFMTGRDRRLAERQMGRETIMHDKEGEQVDRQRKRQEEMWKLEDDRFDLQLKQHKESLELQQEQLKKSREFWEERKQIEEEQIMLQRAYFIQQQELQKQSMEAEAAYATENAKLRQTFNQLQIATELTQGQLTTITEDGFLELLNVLEEKYPEMKKWIDLIGDKDDSSSPKTTGSSSTNKNDQGNHPGTGGFAAGGWPDPSEVSIVGENGYELLAGGKVIPHDRSVQLLGMGLVPGESMNNAQNKINSYYSNLAGEMNYQASQSPVSLRTDSIDYAPSSSKTNSTIRQPIIIQIGTHEIRREVVDIIGNNL